jgi:hypothetical protein
VYNMIEVGDTVRYSNQYLKMGLGTRFTNFRHPRHRRTKQKLMVVTYIIKGRYDWKYRKYTGDIIYTKEHPSGINTHWLRLVRKGTKTQLVDDIPF